MNPETTPGFVLWDSCRTAGAEESASSCFRAESNICGVQGQRGTSLNPKSAQDRSISQGFAGNRAASLAQLSWSPSAAGAGGAALPALGARSGATGKTGASTGSGLGAAWQGQRGCPATAPEHSGAGPGQWRRERCPAGALLPGRGGAGLAPPLLGAAGHGAPPSVPSPRPLLSAERRPAVPRAGLRRRLGLRLPLVRPRRCFQGDLGRRLRRGAAAQPGPARASAAG